MDATKVCPDCRAEFLPTAQQCSDCDVPLVHPDQIVETVPDELPPASELVAIRIAAIGWATEFSESLQEAGLPHRIDAPPAEEGSVQRRSHDTGVAIYVRAEDRDRAMELDAAFLRRQIPDIPESEAAFGAENGCPACGTALTGEPEECPECGLPFLA